MESLQYVCCTASSSPEAGMRYGIVSETSRDAAEHENLQAELLAMSATMLQTDRETGDLLGFDIAS